MTKSFYYECPLGTLKVIESDDTITQIEFLNRAKKPTSPSTYLLTETKTQLDEYFSGDRKLFNLPLNPIGTKFQRLAWNELLKIDYGSTISYSEQAQRLGDSKKSRAVGTANSKNPIPIIIPCHRVIAKSGNLSGYAGGVNIKSYLLDLEAKAE